MLKKFFLTLAIALAVFLILAWIYLPSITRYRELKSEADHLNQKIQEIDAQIKNLADERHLLQTDVAYLEKVIREELGFVKPGEIVYELITKKNPSRASSVTSVAPEKQSTFVMKPSASERARMSPMAVATSLTNTTPKGSKKKTTRSIASPD
jgi:cell division protein FtsB